MPLPPRQPPRRRCTKFRYMPDDPSLRGEGDRERINIHQEHELRYWSEKLGVPPEDLKKAVEDVGPMVKDVEKELRK